MRPFSTPRTLNLRPALAASMAATLAISGTAAVSVAAPTAVYAQAAEASGELNAETRLDKFADLPRYNDGDLIEVTGYSTTKLPWFLTYQPTYANYYTASPGEDFHINAPEYWEFFPHANRRTPPEEIRYEKVAPGNTAFVNPDWVTVHPDGSVEGTVPADAAKGVYTLQVKAWQEGSDYTSEITLYVDEAGNLSYEDLPDYVRYQPKFQRHPLILAPGETKKIPGVAWSDPVRYGDSDVIAATDPNFDPNNPEHVDSHWPVMTDEDGNPLVEEHEIGGKKRKLLVNARAKFETQAVEYAQQADKFCDASADEGACQDGDPKIKVFYGTAESKVIDDPNEAQQYRISSGIQVTAGENTLGFVELPITFNYSQDESHVSWDTVNLPLYIGHVDHAGRYYPVLNKPVLVGMSETETADTPLFIDASDPDGSRLDPKDPDRPLIKPPAGTTFFIPADDNGANYRDWVSIEDHGGKPVINVKPGAKDTLLDGASHRTIDVPIQAQFADGTTSKAFFLPVTVYREKTVYPGRGSQPAGVAVGEVHEGKTRVTAKDKTGKDVPARFNANGELELNPAANATGPITVTVTDPSLGEVTKTVTLGTTTTVSDATTTIYPGLGKQATGITIGQYHEGLTKVTAKDANGKKVTATLSDGHEVLLNPATDVTGPITVTVTDPSLGNPVTKTVTLGTTTTVSNPQATVYPGRGKQATGITIGEYHEGLTKVTAKDANGNNVNATLNDDHEVLLDPATGATGPITVTVTDPSLGEVTKRVTLGTTTTVSDPEATVYPGRGKQATGITIGEYHEGLTKVTAKDANGNNVNATLNDDHEVLLNPAADATGPITVTVTDPSLGEVTKTVTLGTTTTVTGKAAKLDPTKRSQPTGLRVTGGKQPKLSATWEDGKGNSGTIPESDITVDADGNISLIPGTDARGTITLTVSDHSLGDTPLTREIPVSTLAEMYTPEALENHSVIVGTTLDARLARTLITNLGALPSGTTADFAADEQGEAPQATIAGEKNVTIVVTYPDGSTDEVGTVIVVKPRPLNQVKEPTTRNLSITVGDELDPRDAITNPEELQADNVEFVVNDETPDPNTVGTYRPSIKVTYDDGTSDIVATTVTVHERPSDASLYRPKYDSPITVDNEAQVATNQPFNGPAPEKLKAAVLKTPADAVGWTFEIDSDGVITATAPSVDELAQHYARLTQGTDVDWDTIETVLHSVAKPEVFVDFIYEDDSVDSESVVFELNAQDERPLLDPDGDADGDTHGNRKEVEHRSNPFDPEVVPEAPAKWDTSRSSEVYAGESVTVPNTGGIPAPGATATVEGPATATLDQSGDLHITADEGAEPGTAITVTIKNAEGKYLGAARVTVKEDLRSPTQKHIPSYGKDTVRIKPSRKAASPNPYGDKQMPEGTEVSGDFPDDAPGWTFSTDDDAVVHAQAPSIADLAAQYAALGNAEKRDWDKLVAALRPTLTPEADVRFAYPDGSSYIASVAFEMFDQSEISLLSPAGDADGDGITNAQEAFNGSNPFVHDSAKPSWDFTPDDGPLIPGGRISLPNRGGFAPEDLIVDVDGPADGSIDDGGNLIIVVEERAIPGEKVTANVKDRVGDLVDSVTIPISPKAGAAPQLDYSRCLAAGVGFGVPLLALIPLGIATQTAIPGLSDVADQIARQLEDANAQLQQQLGILNPALAKQASEINAQLRKARLNLASVAAGLALVAAGITAGVIIYDACTPAEPGSSDR